MSLIKIENLKKSFRSGGDELIILSNLNLTLGRGSSLSIMGQSGTGKTTLLNLIGGLEKATEGSIISCGINITNLNEKEITLYRQKNIGFIFQFHFLLRDFTALENVEMPGRIAAMKSPKEVRESAEELLETVGLIDRGHHYPSQLSGGERQRAALARALINSPDILLADEPTGNLDIKNATLVEDMLFKMVEKYKKTLILVTHNAELASCSHNICYLSNGKLEKNDE